MRIRAAIARRGERRFSIEDCVLAAEPQRREVRLRLLACGICHTDLAARDQHLRTPLPAVLGHEGVGVIEAVGPDVSGLKIGQRVLASFGACGECASCANHAPAYCRHLATFCLLGRRLDGSSPISQTQSGPEGNGDTEEHRERRGGRGGAGGSDQDGAPLTKGSGLTGHFFGQSSFATHAIVAATNLVPLAEDLPPALMAPLACGVLTGMSAMAQVLGVGPGDAVAISGCGGVGLAAVMAARIMGCERILAIDLNADRLRLATELGATATALADAQGIEAAFPIAAGWEGLSHALDTTGVPAVIETTFLRLLRARGRMVCAGVGRPDAALNLNHNALMLSGKTLRGTIEGDADPASFVPRMIGWYREGLLPLERLVRTYPFEAINDAVDDMSTGRVVKPVLVFDSPQEQAP